MSAALNAGTFLLAAAGEPSKTPFYIAGGVLVAWAVLVAFLGLSRPDFPGTPGRARGVMAISVVLVLGATSMAVATSAKKKREPRAAVAGQGAASAATALSLTADPSGQLKYDKTSLTAPAGKVTIAFVNRSPSGHNVTIEQGGKQVAATPTITGGRADVSADLRPGTYTFYCSVPGHRQAGMQGTLTVR